MLQWATPHSCEVPGVVHGQNDKAPTLVQVALPRKGDRMRTEEEEDDDMDEDEADDAAEEGVLAASICSNLIIDFYRGPL